MLLHEIVAFAAAAEPDGLALLSDGERWTFRQLKERVLTMASNVAAQTARGDRVVIISENTAAMVAALYAVPMAGAIATFANTRHTAAEIIGLIDATGPSLVLISNEMQRQLGRQLDSSIRGATDPATADGATADGQRERPSTAEPIVVSLESMIEPSGAQEATAHSGRPAAGRPHADQREADVDEFDCAWLIHTSGTTGRAKGAMITHRSLIAALTNTAIGRPMADDDIYLMPFPLFHVAAYNAVHAHLRGRPVVLMKGFEAGEALRLIGTESVTNCSLAPTMLAMLLDHPDRTDKDLAGLRQISYGASAMPRDLLLRVTDELPHCGLAQGYGMTELSGNAVFLTPDDHRRAISSHPGLLTAAGRPGPLVRLRIIDDEGSPLEQGCTGEILVRGDQVCAGYWEAPKETATALRDGWLHTGDMGFIDPDGYLHVVDRKKDIIITGGENVASREVEDLLCTHPNVNAVAVIGLPDQRWGEVVSAVVVGAEGLNDPDDLIAWTGGRIAGFKRPRRVFVVDSLPLNASGKVDKAVLRKQFQQD